MNDDDFQARRERERERERERGRADWSPRRIRRLPKAPNKKILIKNYLFFLKKNKL
jgi:hypothetical protein